MDDHTRTMHLAAGLAYGREATCGLKIDYRSESSAERAAEAMTAKSGRALEAYPCVWCEGWHIGRKMDEKERQEFG